MQFLNAVKHEDHRQGNFKSFQNYLKDYCRNLLLLNVYHQQWPSITPPCIVNNDTSNVPPPKSKIRTFFSLSDFESRPYAIAAAVGSLIIRRTFKPAIVPASFVERR
ncbi:unnamed protein product [Pneumocystis jirovecii]|uniref:Uncharacterized protein n=1 Tax=Pneumocystis jirovecii TaxID=42068 RepID=L0P9Y1_PNEJI|nr:unnamed protein product [Pneumocystis jirovecii]